MNKQPVTFVVTINTELSLRELQAVERQLRGKGRSVEMSAVERLKNALSASSMERQRVQAYYDATGAIDAADLERLFLSAAVPLTRTDKLYIICFMLAMPTEDLCTLFNIEPSSTYVVRYRIRHKFPAELKLPF